MLKDYASLLYRELGLSEKLRVSEIVAYLYCQRAWWYQRQGFAPANQRELTFGREQHHKHAQKVYWSIRLKVLAVFLMIMAALLLIAFLVDTWLV